QAVHVIPAGNAIRQQAYFGYIHRKWIRAAAVKEQLTVDVDIFLISFLGEHEVVPLLPKRVIVSKAGECIDVGADALRAPIAATAACVEINHVIAPRSMCLKSAILTGPNGPKRRTISDIIFLDPKGDAQGIILGSGVEKTGIRNINPPSSGGGRID